MRQKRRRRMLLGCGLSALGLIVVLGGCALVVRNNLGQLLSGMVQERASNSINGRLEFDKLEIDLAGRVVMDGIRVYPEGIEYPMLRCERAVISLDFLTFAGPNRGKRAVVISLEGLVANVVREADGTFNLERLVKQPEESQEPIGISLKLNKAKIDFTDHCLLAQGYPRIDEVSGLAEELLNELGYDLLGPAQAESHHEVFTLDGSYNLNAERGQMSYHLSLARQSNGGVINITGTANHDFSEFGADITLQGLDTYSLQSYVSALFPNLQLAEAGSLAAEEQTTPALAVMLDKLELGLVKRKGEELLLEAKLDLSSLYFASAHFPAVEGKSIALDYSAKKQTLVADVDAAVAGLEVVGEVKLDLESDGITASLKVDSADIAVTLAALGMEAQDVSGTLSAQLDITGTTSEPQLATRVTGGQLKAADINLGQPVGEIALDGTVLKIARLSFSGGDLPLRIKGNYDTKNNNGKLEITCSPVKASKLVALAERQTGKTYDTDLQGDLSLNILVNIKAGKASTTLSARSVLLTVEGTKLTDVSLSASITPPNITITSAEAVLSTSGPLDIAGFSSDGPLRVALRIGGSISQLAGGPAVLALVGTAKTSNLAPDQANASFKIIGAADDPEIRLQIKTTHEDHPLVLTAKGHYRRGPAQLEASLDWFNTSVGFGGMVDFANQTINGDLSAIDVDLKRFSGNAALSGKLAATAKVSGTFSKPTIAGDISVPSISYAAGQRSYSISQLEAGFRLAGGNTVSIMNGSLRFEGQEFRLEGVLGVEDSELSITCEDFNLLSAVSLAPDPSPAGVKTTQIRLPLDIQSSGPLSIKLSGDLANPKAQVTYQSGPGQVEGNPFTSLALRGTATLGGVSVEQFDLSSEQGSISLYGTANFNPFSFTANASVDSFDVALLAPLSGSDAIEGLSGLLEGDVQASGDGKTLAASGTLKLVGGMFQGVEIHEASARFSALKDKVRLDELKVNAAGTTLSGSGTFGLQPNDITFDAEAGSIDLDLLHPFLPASFPQIRGTLGLGLKVRPSKGNYPNIDLTLSDLGSGIGLGEGSLSKVSAKLTVRNDILQVKRLEVGAGKSSLVLSGKLDLNKLAQGSIPLDFKVAATDFNITDILGFVPKKYQDYVPGGEVSCKLAIGGNQEHPDLEGWLSFEIDSMPYELRNKPFGSTIIGASGKLNFLRNQGFDIERITLHAGGDNSLHGVLINGSGYYSTRPLGLRNGGITISLAQGGQYTTLYDEDTFRGTVGGLITILGKQGEVPVISGSVVITAPGEKSMYIHAPKKGAEAGTPAPFKFQQFEVVLQAGTTVLYNQTLANMNTELQGMLVLNGRPGVLSGSEALSILGELKVTKGTLMFYKHIVRLEGESNRISFSGAPGDLYPYFSGTGAIVLARVVADNFDPAGSAAPVGNTSSVDKQDLKIFFHFQNVKLGVDSTTLDNILLTSDPPMPRDRILAYLGGVEALLAGEQGIGDFAQGEILAFGSSFITRAIEESFNLRSLRFGGSGEEDNPFYMDVEKQISPQMSLSYYRDFFDDSYLFESSERFGVKYNILHNTMQGNRYQNLDLKLNFEASAFTGDSREFMFEWTTRF